MIKKSTVTLLLLLVLATQAANAVTETVPTYTLADFGMDAVEPGMTLLSESNPSTVFAFPSKTHVNSPHSFHEYFAIGWYPGTFDVTVGVFKFVDPTTGDLCEAKMDETGYIIGAKASIGCTTEYIARAHRAAGAKGVFIMSYLPDAGQPSLGWGVLPVTDLLDYPALELGGMTRAYLIAEYQAGNETVVAMAPGDVNRQHQELLKPEWMLLYLVGNILTIIEGALCVYIRKLMYDQAPANKKWQRTLASTCIEIEFFVALSKFPYALTFGNGYHIFPFPIAVVIIFGSFCNDGANITSGLMIVYWLGLTGAKSMSRKSNFVSKTSIIGICILQFPFFMFTLLTTIGYCMGNIFWSYALLASWGFPPFDHNQLGNTFRLIQLWIFTTLFVVVGVKFLVFLRDSSQGSVNSDARNKMLKRMAMGLIASAASMSFQAYLYYVYNATDAFVLNFTPVGGQKIAMLIQVVSASFVSYTQILIFAGPVLRKKRGVTDASSSKVSTANSGASSSAGVSSSAVSSSSAVGASSGTTTAASSS